MLKVRAFHSPKVDLWICLCEMSLGSLPQIILKIDSSEMDVLHFASLFGICSDSFNQGLGG